jgi:uncharacterized membrane protein YgcG
MERTRKRDPRLLLAVLAIAAVAVTIWAAGAFAAGGSSSSDRPTNDPAAAYIQTQDNQAAPRGDCPEDQGGGNEGSDGGSGSGSSGSGAGDL